jgi:hypothetical protein
MSIMHLVMHNVYILVHPRQKLGDAVARCFPHATASPDLHHRNKYMMYLCTILGGESHYNIGRQALLPGKNSCSDFWGLFLEVWEDPYKN